MKSEQKTEMRTVIYWTCANTSHRHRTKPVAESCIAKHSETRRVTNTWTKELYRQVLERNEAGETLVALGKEFGVCGGRMGQVVRKAKRLRVRERSNAKLTSGAPAAPKPE